MRQDLPPPPKGSTRRRLRAEDWVQAAFTAIGEGGLAAVAVEPLASRLGTTKGSFYWHFANREALIDATLRRWEALWTEAVITSAQAEPDPRQRLRWLFEFTTQAGSADRTEVTLLATADHPQVAPVLRRVTQRRVRYLTDLFTEIGFPAADAHRRALLAFSAYLGHIQLAHVAPDLLSDQRRYLEDVLAALLHREGPGQG